MNMENYNIYIYIYTHTHVDTYITHSTPNITTTIAPRGYYITLTQSMYHVMWSVR